ncbi:terminase gpA endonuclease subunit [Pseudooceanicola marinus]|uniref:terminase gpA endonuclease subunit n=1 Tax=Pseudooceanicola marinus TaxID=396013 RepID=UPI001CD2B2C0|nr:terminase gpA endonuclease subunit [Pseudooceanicola marinus]MCA1337364.1 phage terminase large subunit family protein [Pseudooceanicola marinus]
MQFAPLPPLTTPQEILADCLPILDPPSRVSPTAAAERYVRVEVQGAWQDFDRDLTPYMVEPTDMTQSRRFKGVGFVGPSQSGKTKMLETTAFHAVTCDQRPTLIVHMTKGDRDKWVEEKLDPTIRNSPELWDRLGRGREDSTFSRKRFRGMRLTIGYPTPTILSGGTYGLVLLTDVDHMPLVLGGKDNPEGSPIRMAMRRIRSYMSRGCVLGEGSPAWPVLDPSWRPTKDRPHEMPPVAGGIVVFYNEGTRGRWYWECHDCGGEFEPRFDRLVYDESLDPGDAGDSAEMACPHCGSLLAHRHKNEMNARALAGKGGWRHEGRLPGQLVSIEDEALRKTEVASYALNGAAARFSTWSELVAEYENARRRAETLGDDADLAMCHYTSIGIPHRRLVAEDEDALGVQFLKDHLQPARKGVAPDWTRFITITVDVQKGWFPVQVTAWGEGGRSQVVDRTDMTQPPEGAPNAQADADGNRRRLDPARYVEDWDLLKPLQDRVIPVEGADYGLRAVFVGVDFQGEPGVSDNAEAFLMDRRRNHAGHRWRLTRGQGGWKTPFRVKYEAPDRASNGKRARPIKLLTMATDRLKDTLEASLRKASGGAGAVYLPSWMEENEDQLGEYVAEERLKDGWSKKAGQVRNEGTDLTVQARALAEHKGLLSVNWASPPPWALGGPQNAFAAPLEEDGAAKKDTAAAPQRAAPKQINFLKR